MNNPIFQKHFETASAQVAGAFPRLPELSDSEWDELHALELEINRLWTAEAATLNEFREAVGKYKAWWFGKKK